MVPNTIQHIWLRRLTYQNKSNGSRVITSEKDIISSKLGPYSYGTQNFHFFSRSFIDGSEWAKNIINFSMFCIFILPAWCYISHSSTTFFFIFMSFNFSPVLFSLTISLYFISRKFPVFLVYHSFSFQKILFKVENCAYLSSSI